MRTALDATLVSALITSQFPHWAHLPVRPVARGGWDNRTFHLGTDFLVRLPSAEHYAGQVPREQACLPRLAPQLPLPIPSPVAMGAPGQGYPYHWSVYRWLPGEPAATAQIADINAFARDLAGFLRALQAIATEGAPAPGPENFHRGGSLHVYDEQTRVALGRLSSAFDIQRLRAIWDQGLLQPWTRPAVWVHGDIAPGNLLVHAGRLSAVIDFGQVSAGDPACDLAIAWTFFDANARCVFRDALGLDDGTWLRGQCWALWKAAILASGLVPGGPDETKRAGSTLLGLCVYA